MYFQRKEILAGCNYPLRKYLIKINNKDIFQLNSFFKLNRTSLNVLEKRGNPKCEKLEKVLWYWNSKGALAQKREKQNHEIKKGR